jgi:tetrahydromethanopterin S-methyltransferase subunit G
LEGRINVADARHEDIVDRLERIERKIDHSNGIIAK